MFDVWLLFSVCFRWLSVLRECSIGSQQQGHAKLDTTHLLQCQPCDNFCYYYISGEFWLFCLHRRNGWTIFGEKVKVVATTRMKDQMNWYRWYANSVEYSCPLLNWRERERITSREWMLRAQYIKQHSLFSSYSQRWHEQSGRKRKEASIQNGLHFDFWLLDGCVRRFDVKI